MTVTTDKGLDIDIFEVLDFDFAPPCDATDQTEEYHCPLAAEWKVVVSCCGSVFLFCQEHCDDLLASLSNFVLQCNNCNAEFYNGAEAILSMDRI